MKDCKIVFTNKQTYEFSFEDLHKAVKFCADKKVWAIETPFGVWQPMDKEFYENTSDAVFGGPIEDGADYGRED